MMQIYAIPHHGELSDLYEGGVLPRMAYFAHSVLRTDGRSRSMHQHTNVTELVLVCKGEGIHCVDAHTYHTHPGDFIIYNQNSLHDERAAVPEGMELFCCGIAGLQLKGQAAGRLALTPGEVCVPSGETFPKLRLVMEWMEQAIQSGPPDISRITDGLLCSLLAMVRGLLHERVAVAVDRSDRTEIVRAMRAYLDAHYTEPFTLSDLAAAFRVSPYYAAHLFREETGYAPMQYRLQRRIGEAQSLLTDTSYSITQIAQAVGYDNPNHFTQRFTKVVGVSPRQFRRQSVSQSSFPERHTEYTADDWKIHSQDCENRE